MERTVDIPIRAEEDVSSQTISLLVEVLERGGFDADPFRIAFETRELQPPDFQVIGPEIDDDNRGDSQGNANGKFELGEIVEVGVVVQNRGSGVGEAVHVRPGVTMDEGGNARYESATTDFLLGDLAPEEHRKLTFAISTNKRYKAESVLIALEVTERRGRFGRTRVLSVPLGQTVRPVEEVVIPGREDTTPGKVSLEVLPAFNVDVDMNIPGTTVSNPDGIGVLIGIARYQQSGVPTVDFAARDAATMKEYLVTAMGFDPVNLFEVYNEEANLTAFKRIFEAQLGNRVRPGQSDVFVYYSGHSVPDPETREAYFAPYDCDPAYAKVTGYSLKTFYEQLSRLPARSVTVVLDACFSGQTAQNEVLLKGISPALLMVNDPAMTLPNGVVFTSSTAQQVSSWYPEKKHGLFTYFFLKGLQGEADANRDRGVTVAEIDRYVGENVPYWARRLNNREQTPQVRGAAPGRVLVTLNP
jgi:hypothetical protein